VVRSVRAMATFHPTPFGALTASAKDLPASLNAASNACGHRAHLISAISVADISGDNARWAGWRALALRQPAGPIGLFAAAVPGRLAPPGERRWCGRQVAMGAAMGRRKQSGDRNVADPGAGGRQVAMGAAMGRRKQSGDRSVNCCGWWGRAAAGCTSTTRKLWSQSAISDRRVSWGA